jgi:hypothetical protein
MLVLSLLCLTPPLYADDAYLKELEVEAKKLDADSKSKPLKSNGENVLPVQKQRKFELLLQSSRPSTYNFYQKLNQDEKNLVLLTYEQDNKLSSASKKVFELYFEKNK